MPEFSKQLTDWVKEVTEWLDDALSRNQVVHPIDRGRAQDFAARGKKLVVKANSGGAVVVAASDYDALLAELDQAEDRWGALLDWLDKPHRWDVLRPYLPEHFRDLNPVEQAQGEKP